MKTIFALIALVLFSLGIAIDPNWRSLITHKDDKEDYSVDKIEKLFNIEYDPNDYFEEMMSGFTPASPFASSNIKSTCEERRTFSGPDFLQFLPQKMAVIRNPDQVVLFSNDCFKKNTIKMISKDKGKIVISLSSSDGTSYFCKDSYLLTTSNRFKVKIVFFKGEHLITLDDVSDDEMLEIGVNGIRVFGFCENIVESIISIYKTYRLFTDTEKEPEQMKNYPYYQEKTTEELEKDHLEFLKKFSNFDIEPRGPMGDTPLPVEDTIQSGDFFGLSEPRSFGSVMLMYFTGGPISHAAMALRLENNDLYVVEMKGAGLTISTWKEFVDKQIKTHHYVVHCPLKKEYREKFNTQKAYEYFLTLGKKYGGYVVTAPWFDIPDRSTPIYLPEESIMLFLSLMDKYQPSSSYSLFRAALNMRLGTSNLTTTQIVLEAAKRNMTFEELLSVPENDAWRYDTGENIVCSSFVMHMYKVGGLFDGLTFNAKEFQPKDIYLLDIFDKQFDRPQICREIDPELPYCQILGRYRIKLNGYSTVVPHDHMFDHCPSVPPFYNITDMC